MKAVYIAIIYSVNLPYLESLAHMWNKGRVVGVSRAHHVVLVMQAPKSNHGYCACLVSTLNTTYSWLVRTPGIYALLVSMHS